MFGGKEKPRLVGAKKKREMASGKDPRLNEVRSQKEGGKESAVVPLTVIFGFAAVLATLLTEGMLKTSGLGINTGISDLDKFFAAGTPSFTGTPDTDKLILIFGRAFIMFLVAGFIPFCTFIWQKVFDKARANLYFAFWGTSIGIFLLYFVMKDAVVPLIETIIAGA